MGAPQDWVAAASPPSGSSSNLLPLSNRGGYWFITSTTGSGPWTYQVQFSTDPDTGWADATLPALSVDNFSMPVEFDGTYYGTVQEGGTSYTDHVVDFIYCTDPAGTWTSVNIVDDADYSSISYLVTGLACAAGLWVVSGSRRTLTSSAAFLAYASDPTGAWTIVDDPTAGGLGVADRVGYGDSEWVLYGSLPYPAEDWLAYTASVPSGTWSACSSFPTVVVTDNWTVSPPKYLNGYHVVVTHGARYAPTYASENRIFYAATASGTWSEVDETGIGLAVASSETVRDVTYFDASWILSCSGSSGAAARYLDTAGSPAGSYAGVADSDLDYLSGRGIDNDGTTVAMSETGSGLWYAPVVTTIRRWLRQRQSPTAHPTRVGFPNVLRQRQHP